jgi:hypothetical protein
LFVHHFKTVEGFKVASKEVNKVINNDSPDTPNPEEEKKGTKRDLVI